ncbi:MAG TPA: hypothetical protein VFP18_08820, partial [Candidatus Binatia bacterium]|nr:hypothetical protein [Candidatus Binatia bacterium]
MGLQKVYDADGHVLENDNILLEFLDPPYRGKKKLLNEPLFPSVDGWHRRAMGIGDGRASDLGPDLIVDDVPSWLAMMDRTGIEETVLYPTIGLAEGLIKDADWAVA